MSAIDDLDFFSNPPGDRFQTFLILFRCVGILLFPPARKRGGKKKTPAGFSSRRGFF
jgi:hypothetical protein